MVGGSSHDACWQNRRHALAVGAAGRTRNPKGLCRSSSFLADITLRQFWSVRAPQSYIGNHADTLRRSCSRRDRNDPRIGAGFRTNGPYLRPANAPSRQDIANKSRSRGSRIRPDYLYRAQSAYHTGNGKKPTSLPPQPGCWIVAPFLPHALQRARCRSRSLDTSAPHRMTATAQASGA